MFDQSICAVDCATGIRGMIVPSRTSITTGICPFAAPTAPRAQGLVCLPSDNVLRKVDVTGRNGRFTLTGDPLAGEAASTVHLYSQPAK